MPAVLEKPDVRKELTRYEKPVLFPRDPMRLFDWMREEMDRVFETLPFGRLAPFVPRTVTPWMPALEVFEKNGVLHLRADLPGLKREDVVIEATEEGITIKGERKLETKEEKEGYFRTERVYGEFCRFVPLPEGALVDKIEANFTDGVLNLTVPVPKLETKVPKRIAIT